MGVVYFTRSGPTNARFQTRLQRGDPSKWIAPSFVLCIRTQAAREWAGISSGDGSTNSSVFIFFNSGNTFFANSL
jgi:hypothetical protein